MASASARRGREKRIWEVLAYGARYGHQPLSELRQMTIAELERFTAEVSSIIEVENTPREG